MYSDRFKEENKEKGTEKKKKKERIGRKREKRSDKNVYKKMYLFLKTYIMSFRGPQAGGISSIILAPIHCLIVHHDYLLFSCLRDM